MLFNIEYDSGDRIIGYLVPDAFSEIPELRFVSQGRELFRMAANTIKPALVEAGRHAGGQCGFDVSTADIPDLADRYDLAIFEAATEMLIYRRRQPQNLARRILRLETQLYPLWRIDNVLDPYFQYFNKSLERFGRETVTQMFLLNNLDSIYLSGRVQFKNFSYYIENGFDVYCIIQDPFDEFSERLLVFRQIDENNINNFGERDAQRFAPAVAYCKTLDLDDAKRLQRQLHAMPIEVAHLFADPLVRQLTTTTPDEMPSGAAIASALDMLSSFEIVGLRENAGSYVDAISEALNIPRAHFPDIPVFPKVQKLSETIRKSRAVDHLLEKDRALYSILRSAHQKISDESEADL